MKQQQILCVALVLLAQQVYCLTAVNSTADGVSDPARSDVTNKTTSTIHPDSPTTSTSTEPTTNKPSTPVPTPITTDAPTTTIKPPEPSQQRHFDLPSFIGGIVLTLGLIGISFVGHKIYKSKFDRNYHTL